MTQKEKLRRLASEIIEIIRCSPDVLYGKYVEVPDLEGASYNPPLTEKMSTLPLAHRFFEDIISLDHSSALRTIIERFREVEELLHWGHAPGYTRETVGQQFLDSYCHALLSGPDGPLECPSPLGAFVLFGPETLYKDHSHAPNEVYLALTGGGEWRVDHHDWLQLEAGQTVFIPSNVTHAIRTAEKPLLTFSFWLDPGEMSAIAI